MVMAFAATGAGGTSRSMGGAGVTVACDGSGMVPDGMRGIVPAGGERGGGGGAGVSGGGCPVGLALATPGPIGGVGAVGCCAMRSTKGRKPMARVRIVTARFKLSSVWQIFEQRSRR